jgi:hypothetical protein
MCSDAHGYVGQIPCCRLSAYGRHSWKWLPVRKSESLGWSIQTQVFVKDNQNWSLWFSNSWNWWICNETHSRALPEIPKTDFKSSDVLGSRGSKTKPNEKRWFLSLWITISASRRQVHTFHAFIPGRSEQNAQRIWSNPFTQGGTELVKALLKVRLPSSKNAAANTVLQLVTRHLVGRSANTIDI